MQDVYTGKAVCSHPSCHWSVDEGWSGIEARYENAEGEPACWTHRDASLDTAREE